MVQTFACVVDHIIIDTASPKQIGENQKNIDYIASNLLIKIFYRAKRFLNLVPQISVKILLI